MRPTLIGHPHDLLSNYHRLCLDDPGISGSAVMTCEVCGDPEGRYCIVTMHGKTWGTIECPACYGSGQTDDENQAEFEQRQQERRIADIQKRYDELIAAQRARAQS